MFSLNFVLHQATTSRSQVRIQPPVYYIFILHQTTTTAHPYRPCHSCIIFLFCIKPQLVAVRMKTAPVVLYFYSTSNHNTPSHLDGFTRLCYISILHQTTTCWKIRRRSGKLCYISILHQTTTGPDRQPVRAELCYISILHQTTTVLPDAYLGLGCVIFLFYIKPQRYPMHKGSLSVVLYFYSTSNHNMVSAIVVRHRVVLYFYSTSNHNTTRLRLPPRMVVLYFYSTSNHNGVNPAAVLGSVVLYFYSTSNHNRNDGKMDDCAVVLYFYSTSNHNEILRILIG